MVTRPATSTPTPGWTLGDNMADQRGRGGPGGGARGRGGRGSRGQQPIWRGTGANRWNPYYSSFFAEKHKEIRISSENVVHHLYGWPMKKLKIVFVLI